MAIRYSRIASDDENISFSYIFRTKDYLPLAFIKQQIVLVAIVSIASFVLLLTTFFAPDVEYELIREISHELNYGVIVDCGSSGTRAHIFRWKHDGQKLVRLDLLRDNKDKPLTKHIVPGLSSLRDEPDRASDYMEPIMNFISGAIPLDQHADTPIYFFATAGMRLLEDSTQRRILSDITRDLTMKFDFPRIKSQVITGQYEGVFSWLSLNRNRVYNNSNTSIGMIEMGGASVQVTFEITPETEQDLIRNLEGKAAISTFQNEQIKLELFDNSSVKLFATTFLGLGVNSARESAIDVLVRDYLNGTGQLGEKKTENFEVRLVDPCLTIGSSESVMRPANLISSADRSVGLILKKDEKAFRVKLEGSGNFLNCLTLLERVIKTIKVEKLNCSPELRSCPMELLGNSFIPFSQYPFVGLSELFFTTDEMIHSSGTFNRTQVLRETNRVCSNEYKRLIELYSHGHVTRKDRIFYECFKASWLLTVMHSSGFKMPVSYDNFRTVDNLNGEEIDWTIGAMLWELDLDRDKKSS